MEIFMGHVQLAHKGAVQCVAGTTEEGEGGFGPPKHKRLKRSPEVAEA